MGKKILFVDDSASMRQVVGIALKNAGYDVTAAVDGRDAVSKLSDRFAAIVTDLNMPNMNGIDLIKAVKQNANNKFAPVIMLTTESSEAMKKQGQAAGAKVWIIKPFKPDQLLGVLTKLLG
ncbi:MAG: response regulator [Gammaproteobacteria bacterium]|jgi:two-component system chemotaxis response regulator CheY|nr:response regulator [Gammaproteobacteria bacterium]MBT3725252.1 response regulator [Gammaproteobacteria bacterium]MBT4075221.1 response regulator [Gammaproteobacteria bacterium]MBT4195254.1 response regulator [Gammaproteobacteria bacterium]MBT4452122.1 response regulator [Gammaproteobacteria bacterium]